MKNAPYPSCFLDFLILVLWINYSVNELTLFECHPASKNHGNLLNTNANPHLF